MIQSEQATDHQEAPVDGDATSRAVELVLGLPGFVVLAVGEYGGELEVLIETPLTSVACGRCGRPASPHARREHLLRDMPMAGRPAVLVWHKRIWRCRTVECPRQTWSEAASWASLTERAKAWVARRVGAEGESVAAVARSLGLGWTTVMRAVAEIAAPLVEAGERIAAVAAVGIDEHAWQRAIARRQTQWATGIVDLSPARPAAGCRRRPLGQGVPRLDRRPRTGLARGRTDRRAGPVPRLPQRGTRAAAPRGARAGRLPRHPAGHAGTRRGPPPRPTAHATATAATPATRCMKRGGCCAAAPTEYLAYFDTSRGLQRPHRGNQPTDRKDPPCRPRIPQLEQLPTAATTALRNRMAYRIDTTDQEAPSTLHNEEPVHPVRYEASCCCAGGWTSSPKHSSTSSRSWSTTGPPATTTWTTSGGPPCNTASPSSPLTGAPPHSDRPPCVLRRWTEPAVTPALLDLLPHGAIDPTPPTRAGPRGPVTCLPPPGPLPLVRSR